MRKSDRTRDLVLRYFDAWRRKDRDKQREYTIESPAVVGPSDDDELTEVNLLASIFEDEQGVLFYEATERGSRRRRRYAEHVTVVVGRIAELKRIVTF